MQKYEICMSKGGNYYSRVRTSNKKLFRWPRVRKATNKVSTALVIVRLTWEYEGRYDVGFTVGWGSLWPLIVLHTRVAWESHNENFLFFFFFSQKWITRSYSGRSIYFWWVKRFSEKNQQTMASLVNHSTVTTQNLSTFGGLWAMLSFFFFYM